MRWPNCLTWSDSAFCVASLPICTSAIPPCAAFSMNLRSLDETVEAFSFIELIAFGDDVDCWLMLDDGGLADFAAPVASGVRVCAATAAATQNDTTPTIFAGMQKRLVDMRFLRNVTSRCLWQRQKLRGGSRGTRDQQISCNIRACERGSRPLAAESDTAFTTVEPSSDLPPRLSNRVGRQRKRDVPEMRFRVPSECSGCRSPRRPRINVAHACSKRMIALHACAFTGVGSGRCSVARSEE